MGKQRFGFFLLLALLFPWRSAVGQGAPAPAGGAQGAYAESPDGLKSLVLDICAAKKAANDAEINKLLAGLVLPNHEAWMVATFGEPLGKRIAATYTERHDRLPTLLSSAIATLMDEGLTQVEIVTHDEPFVRLPGEGPAPAIILSKLRPTRLYDVRFQSADRQKTKSLWHFAYVDGGFRYIGTLKPAPPESQKQPPLLQVPPSTGGGEGPLGGSIQMLTPDEGVDFTNYLDRVLASVRRNWYAVIPESARMGEKGRVVLQFRILRDGNVPLPEPNLLLTSTKELLDRAAMSSIRASSPFESLPPAFHGPHIELRFIFVYNLPPSATPDAPSPPSPSNGQAGGVPGGSNTPPPPEAAPQRIRVGGTVMQAKVLNMVAPVYPPLARQARIQGTVRLHAVIAKDGSVIWLEVLPGAHPLLVRAALDAVRQWMYQPVLLNGEAVEVDTTVDVVFSLDKKPPKKN
jgi:TonB family protein